MKKKVGVLLSGGVDSAVALYLLLEKGYDVSAFHIKTVLDEFYIQKEIKHKVCCSPSDTYDAQKIAEKLNVPFEVIHVEDIFRKTVIDYYLKENVKGRTPNPCYFCNDWIKFGVVFDYILEKGYDYVASGHYARVIDGKLYKGIDESKDQSYFLASIKKEKFQKILLPLGDYSKDQIREIAKNVEIHVAEKKESQDLCFIPDNDFEAFLKENGVEFNEGNIITTDGKIIGRHKGLPLYTIGQRKLGVAYKEKLYVIAKSVDGNFVLVGREEDAYSKEMIVENVNYLVEKSELEDSFSATVKIRKKFKEVPCKVKIVNDNLKVEIEEPAFAVTPGQIATFYKDDLVICSGVIK